VTDLRHAIEAARAADAAEFVRIRRLTRENAIPEARLAALGITVETWARDIASGALVGYVARQGGKIEGYCFGDTLTGDRARSAARRRRPGGRARVARQWRPTGRVDANADEMLELRLTLPAP